MLDVQKWWKKLSSEFGLMTSFGWARRGASKASQSFVLSHKLIRPDSFDWLRRVKCINDSSSQPKEGTDVAEHVTWCCVLLLWKYVEILWSRSYF